MPLNTTRHFGDGTFQAINCTATDNLRQRNKITRASQTQKNKRKTYPR